jgi:DNA repair photolyase
MYRTHQKCYEDWLRVRPRTQIPDLLREDVKVIKQNEIELPDIMLCSICDAYQPIELKCEITRNVIQILRENNLPFTVLTKSTNVLRDLDLFVGYAKCRVGFTIITLDDNFRKEYEPNSSPIEERCEALKILKDNGIPTYCSVEPILPCEESNPIQIVKTLREYVDLFEFGKLNLSDEERIPDRCHDEYYRQVFRNLIPYCEREGIKRMLKK